MNATRQKLEDAARNAAWKVDRNNTDQVVALGNKFLAIVIVVQLNGEGKIKRAAAYRHGQETVIRGGFEYIRKYMRRGGVL